MIHTIYWSALHMDWHMHGLELPVQRPGNHRLENRMSSKTTIFLVFAALLAAARGCLRTDWIVCPRRNGERARGQTPQRYDVGRENRLAARRTGSLSQRGRPSRNMAGLAPAWDTLPSARRRTAGHFDRHLVYRHDGHHGLSGHMEPR